MRYSTKAEGEAEEAKDTETEAKEADDAEEAEETEETGQKKLLQQQQQQLQKKKKNKKKKTIFFVTQLFFWLFFYRGHFVDCCPRLEMRTLTKLRTRFLTLSKDTVVEDGTKRWEQQLGTSTVVRQVSNKCCDAALYQICTAAPIQICTATMC